MTPPAPAPASPTVDDQGTAPIWPRSRPRCDGELAELASHLRLAVARLHRRARQEAVTAGDDLSASRLAALATIEKQGPITLGELAAEEQVQPPSMTRIVARLEEQGLVAREVDPADRRVARVVVTPAGTELLAVSRTRRTAFLAQRVARFTDDERRAARPRAAAARTHPGRRLTPHGFRTRPRIHHLPVAPHPQLQAVLLRPGRLAHRHVDADDRARLAGARPVRQQRVRGRLRARAAVLAHAAVRRVGWRDRRPLRQAHGAGHHAVGDGGHRRGARPARRHRRRHALDGLRARLRVRHRAGGRQPRPPLVRVGDGRPGRHLRTRSGSTARCSRSRASSVRRSPVC